jgi:hypothetical protein
MATTDTSALNALYDDLDGLSPTHRDLFFRLLRREGESLAQLGIPRRSAPDGAPLSFAQQRIWAAGRPTPNASVDNVPVAVRLTGPVSAERLQAAFAAVAERHDVLRSVLRETGDEPGMAVAADWTLPFETVDGRDGSLTEADLQAAVTERARTPFVLTSGPLIRVTLFHLADDDHVLLVVLHQLVSDGLSVRLMLTEVSALYAGDEAAAALPERRIEYRDFADWQRTWMAVEDLPVQRAYWHDRFADGGAPAVVLSDREGPAGAPYAAATEPVRWPLRLSDRLRAVATAQRATSYMTILAALHVVLRGLTGQTDATVGSLVSSRTLPETESLLGNFSNTLLLRTETGDVATFADMLDRVREEVLAAYRHQDYPFQALARFLRTETEAEGPLFPVMLILRDSILEDTLTLERVAVRPYRVDLGESRLKWSLDLVDDGTGPIHGTLLYATDLFTPARVRAILDVLTVVLERAVADVDVPLADLLRSFDGTEGAVPSAPTSASTSGPATPSDDLAASIRKIGF